MKKFIELLLSSLLILCIYQKTNAQSEPENVFKINPFSLFVGNCTFFYERKVSDCSTLQLGMNFMPEPIRTFGASFSCFGLTPEWRIYFSQRLIDVPGGGYIAPFCRYRCFTMTPPSQFKRNGIETINDEQNAVGFVLGYQVITSGDIAFDFFAGPFYNANHIALSTGQQIHYDVGYLGTDGMGLRVGAAIGLAL